MEQQQQQQHHVDKYENQHVFKTRTLSPDCTLTLQINLPRFLLPKTWTRFRLSVVEIIKIISVFDIHSLWLLGSYFDIQLLSSAINISNADKLSMTFRSKVTIIKRIQEYIINEGETIGGGGGVGVGVRGCGGLREFPNGIPKYIPFVIDVHAFNEMQRLIKPLDLIQTHVVTKTYTLPWDTSGLKFIPLWLENDHTIVMYAIELLCLDNAAVADDIEVLVKKYVQYNNRLYSIVNECFYLTNK